MIPVDEGAELQGLSLERLSTLAHDTPIPPSQTPLESAKSKDTAAERPIAEDVPDEADSPAVRWNPCLWVRGGYLHLADCAVRLPPPPAPSLQACAAGAAHSLGIRTLHRPQNVTGARRHPRDRLRSHSSSAQGESARARLRTRRRAATSRGGDQGIPAHRGEAGRVRRARP